jgi:epoxyqueuosine reductase QueG
MAVDDRTSLTQRFKEVAFRNGVDLIGICDSKIFDDIPMEDRPMDITSDARAVVVYGIRYSETGDLFKESWYRKMDELVGLVDKKLREFLTENGYKAHSISREFDVADEIQGRPFSELTRARRRQWRGAYQKLQDAAVSAGLGWLGKNRIIITPQYGAHVSLSMIVTDAPLIPDEPFDEDLCGDCDLCLKNCPTGAILAKGHPDESLCKPWDCQFACVRVCHENWLKQQQERDEHARGSERGRE